LNIHPSLLPKYKGLNTHARALASNDPIAGCSVHLVTAELDGGPVLAQTEVSIEKNETAESVEAKVLVQEHLLYPKVLLNFSNDLKKSPAAKNCN
jgi:phosphoribosylglycinamide formyltransferase-1